jgi:hypothetical protein
VDGPNIEDVGFDVLTSKAKIKGKNITCVIDTGASTSVISKELTRNLNLCVDTSQKVELTMAGNQIVNTLGNCSNVPILFGNKECNISACVIANPAHELLLGTNFLSKYGIILDLGEEKMYIPNGKNEYVTNEISASKQKGMNKNKKRKMKLYSKSRVTVKPNCEKIIEVDELKNDIKISSNSVLLCEQCTNKPFFVIPGVADTCNLPSKLIVQNISPKTITIQKNEVVSLVNESKKTIISEIRNNEYPIDINDVIKSCELISEKEIDLFRKKLKNELKSLDKINQSLVVHEIRLVDENKNHDISARPYRTNTSQKKEIENQVEKLKNENLIRDSNSRYCSPVVMVKKKDGSVRFCVDYRKINNITVKDKFPLPRIDETLDRLGSSQYFTSIDLKSGYWQIPIKESDKDKTAFVTHNGLYEWNVIPFGLCNAPATFQRYMNSILGKLGWEFCLVYLDDIIIFSNDFEEHVNYVCSVLKEILKSGLRINFSKSRFFCRKIEYLGYVIDSSGISISKEKTKAIYSYPQPKNIKQVQQF